MILQWLLYANTSVFSTPTDSLVSVRRMRFAASSATRRRASSRSCGAQKNGLQGVWSSALWVVRPYDTTSAGSVLWQHARLFGTGSPACSLPMLRQGEARAPRLSCRQPVLHEAVCLVRRATLPKQHHQGCCRGTASGLADRQGTRQAIHGGTVGAGWHSRSEGYWYRRDLDSQGAHLPHRGERPDSAPADLVWRRRSFGSQHEPVLRLAGREEDTRHPSGGHGYVEAISQRHHQTSTPDRHPVRQVSRHEASTTRSTRYARPSTPGCLARSGATSRARSMSC